MPNSITSEKDRAGALTICPRTVDLNWFTLNRYVYQVGSAIKSAAYVTRGASSVRKTNL